MPDREVQRHSGRASWVSQRDGMSDGVADTSDENDRRRTSHHYQRTLTAVHAFTKARRAQLPGGQGTRRR
jgi:hypothetical protein